MQSQRGWGSHHENTYADIHAQFSSVSCDNKSCLLQSLQQAQEAPSRQVSAVVDKLLFI